MLLLRRVVGRVAACGGAGGGGAARPCYALPQRLLAAVGSRAPFSALALGCARALPAQPQPVRARLSSSGGAAAPPEVGLLGLNNLAPNPGAHKPARRVGRGRGGGRGKTSGRGHKGAGARKGKKIPYVGFEGGQSPLYRRIPKRGFKNTRFKREYAELNLDTLAHFIRSSRLQQPLEREIGLKELSDSGAVSISMCAPAPHAPAPTPPGHHANPYLNTWAPAVRRLLAAQAPRGRQAARHRHGGL